MQKVPNGFTVTDAWRHGDTDKATVRVEMDAGHEPGEFIAWLVRRLRETGHPDLRVTGVNMDEPPA